MKILLSKPHMCGEEILRVNEAFASGFIAPAGPQLDEFEDIIAKYLGDNLYCVGLASGTAALHLALRIAGVGAGDEVWISSMTFAGGVFPISYLGAIPKFFDLDPENWTLSTNIIGEQFAKAKKENKLPKAIIPTDLYGQSVDVKVFEDMCHQYGVSLIIDSAESLGAKFSSTRQAGSGGDASILSFNGNKIITTSGGGMLVTKHKDWADKARFLSTQARDPAPHYEHTTYGYNYRLSNICAAIGLGQMQVLNQRVRRRREIFDRYRLELQHPGITFMPEPKNNFSSHWLTVLHINPQLTGISREDIRKMLLANQIESRPLWKPMHMQPLYASTEYVGNFFDEELFANGICLPSGSDLSIEQQDEVIQRILLLLSSRS